jgi:hypothetical protein
MRETKRRAGDRGDASSPGKRTVSGRGVRTSAEDLKTARKSVPKIIFSLPYLVRLFSRLAHVVMSIDHDGLLALDRRRIVEVLPSEVGTRRDGVSSLYSHLAFRRPVSTNLRRNV